MTKLISVVLGATIASLFSVAAVAGTDTVELTTYADGRPDGGIRTGANNEDGQDTPGDVFVFDQKLLAANANDVIGRNAGYCIRTDPGALDYSGADYPDDQPQGQYDDPTNNYGACQWTLVFNAGSGFSGSLTVAGREADIGTSLVPIVGGTGDFTGATGVLVSTPNPQDPGTCLVPDSAGNCGVLFKQELIITLPHQHDHDSDDDSDDDSDSDSDD